MYFLRFVGIVPMGVGLTLLVSLWVGLSPFDDAPLFFKLMGSFVSLMFISVGSVFLFATRDPREHLTRVMEELNKRQGQLARCQDPAADTLNPPAAGYQCTTCGATLDDRASVSPHGDVKCEHCGRWFNIHKA